MSTAERERNYRARHDADVQRRQQYLETERDRWRKDIEAGKKMIGKCGPPMSVAERQRIYRARRDADVQRRQQYLETERDRWRKDVEAGKKMLQRDRSESRQCAQRKKWREVHERRKARKTLLEDRDGSRGGLVWALSPSGGGLPLPKPPSPQTPLTDFYVNQNSLAPVVNSQPPHSPPSHHFLEPSLLEEEFNNSPTIPETPVTPEIKLEAEISESSSSSHPGTSRQHDIGRKCGPPMSAAERQRIYRARRDADVQRRQQYLETERDRWRKDVEAGKKILQKDRSESGQCAQRIKWREVHERRKARKTLHEDRDGSRGGLVWALSPSGGGLPLPKPPSPQTPLTDFYVNQNSLAPVVNSQPPHRPPSHHFLEPSLLEEEFNNSPTIPKTTVTPEIKLEAEISESSSSSHPGTSRQHDIGRKCGPPMSAAERQRIYRARCDADVQRRQQYLETERDRWRKDVEAGKKILQKDRSESGQCAQRIKWREVHERRKARKTLLEGFSSSSQPGTSRQNDIGSRRRWAGQNKSKRKQQDNQDQTNFLYNLEKGNQESAAYMTLTLL